jgi:EAL domain-containing protein (putative c-di-GMP-specific phosphodiesterase class I)
VTKFKPYENKKSSLGQLAGPSNRNVGARQLQQVNFIENLKEALAAHPGISPGNLQLEVLETSALELAGAAQIIKTCRELGVMFAMDDFGTGYSSLTYLKRLPVTEFRLPDTGHWQSK